MSSYEALYRKYRPQTFRELAGQDPVASTLRNEVRCGRLTHAYLFTGPRGTGKTTTARLLAKALNCVRGPTVDPCGPPADRSDPPDPTGVAGECPQCRAIRLGNHIDVVEIDAASNRGIEDIRSLQERVRLAPVQGTSKVFIIDEVHMLTEAAWNALLKTLEEPPPNCVFVLATTEVHKVLATVLSRCQRFDFQRIGHAALKARLGEVAAAEGLDLEDEATDAIARRADGGLRDALSLLDQVAAGVPSDPADQRRITAAAVFEALGLISGDAVLSLGDALARKDAVAALSECAALLAAGHDHRAIVRELLGWARNVLLLQLAPDQAAALEIPAGQVPRLGAHAQDFSRPELLAALEILRQTDQELRGSSQATIWLEMGLLRLCDRMEIPSIVDLAARVAALEARLESGSPPPARASSAAAVMPSARAPAPVNAPVSRPDPAPLARPDSLPAETAPGGSFELARQADAARLVFQEEPATADALAALKEATRGLRVSLRSNFDQFVMGATRPDSDTVVVHMRQDTLFKEGSEGYKALLPLVRGRFGEGTKLEITTQPPGNEPVFAAPLPAPAREPAAPPPPSRREPAAEPQAGAEALPPPGAGRQDPVALASELLLGKILGG